VVSPNIGRKITVNILNVNNPHTPNKKVEVAKLQATNYAPISNPLRYENIVNSLLYQNQVPRSRCLHPVKPASLPMHYSLQFPYISVRLLHPVQTLAYAFFPMKISAICNSIQAHSRPILTDLFHESSLMIMNSYAIDCRIPGLLEQ
jgi:hypothetical protein